KWREGYGTRFIVISFKSTLRDPSNRMEHVKSVSTCAAMVFMSSKAPDLFAEPPLLPVPMRFEISASNHRVHITTNYAGGHGDKASISRQGLLPAATETLDAALAGAFFSSGGPTVLFSLVSCSFALAVLAVAAGAGTRSEWRAGREAEPIEGAAGRGG